MSTLKSVNGMDLLEFVSAASEHSRGHNSTVEMHADDADALVAEVERLTAERNRLWTQREGFDCHYAGPYAETSGIHCPLDEPCLRCENERLTAERDGLAKALTDIRDATYYKAIHPSFDLGAFAHNINIRARAALGNGGTE